MKTESKYTILKTIGSGTFGEIKLAQRADGTEVVIKKILRTENRMHLIKNEIEASKKLKHKGIVHFVESFEDPCYTYLVLEYIRGKDLFQTLDDRSFQPVHEHEAKSLFRKICESVNHCHKKGFAHLDLKLENILIDEHKQPRLIDFGLCSIMDSKRQCKRWAGSPDYASPQILLREAYDESKADVWSLGIVLYIMLVGQIPFDRDERVANLRQGFHPTLDWATNNVAAPHRSNQLSNEVKNLLEGMLDVNPKNRLSIAEVLKHKWLKKKRESFIF